MHSTRLIIEFDLINSTAITCINPEISKIKKYKD